MTDACHGWRRNASVHKCDMYWSENTYLVTQRHKIIGTKKNYEYFNGGPVLIKCHTHDKNLSVNSFVKKRERNGTCIKSE